MDADRWKLIKQIIWNVIRKMGLAPIVLRFHPKSALVQNGWNQSFYENEAIDEKGNPIPWWTYPFINFIKERISKKFRVFEYGCGNSTIWFSNRVSEIISVEHELRWAEKISPRLSNTGRIIVRGLSNGYVEEIGKQGLFDIVIIDGRLRNECCIQCVKFLRPDGVIIWDDSNMPDYIEGFSYLSKIGFRAINFYGMVPGLFISSQTSIIYRSNNCLGI